MELRGRATFAPSVVIAVLAPANGVGTRCLDVPVGIGTDPDVRPCGRDDQARDPLERCIVGNSASRVIDVAEPAALDLAVDAGAVRPAPAEPAHGRGLGRSGPTGPGGFAAGPHHHRSSGPAVARI